VAVGIDLFFSYFIKVQGQGGSSTQYKGVFDVIGHLYKEGGIRSIYRGTYATLARDGPGSAACVSLTGRRCLSS
jgi:transmembrane carrier protein